MDEPQTRHPSTESVIRVTFKNIEETIDGHLIHYTHKQAARTARLRNPEVLCGRLIQGAEIPLTLYPAENEAELNLTEEDLLPADFTLLLNFYRPAFRTPFGLVTDEYNGEQRYYLLLEYNAGELLICSGTCRIEDGVGYCDEFDALWKIRPGLLEHYFEEHPFPPSPVEEWTHPLLQFPRPLPELKTEDLTREFRDGKAPELTDSYFKSSDWSPEFYRAQARLGYIAVARQEKDTCLLIPELQEAYALLDWPELTVDRQVKRIMESGRLESSKIRLRIDGNPDQVLAELDSVWSDDSWLYPPYLELIRRLASRKEVTADPGFRIWGVTLTVGTENRIAAGELGYTVGSTYTSLSGFFHRENREWNNFGKLQLVLLARALEEAGIAFWNLGHPWMQYKIRLGAKILQRQGFLERWDKETQGVTPNLSR